MAKKKNPSPADRNNSPPEFNRELIVVTKAQSDLRVWGDEVSSPSATDVSPLSDFLKNKSCKMTPLFGLREEKLKARIASFDTAGEQQLDEMLQYYHVESEQADLDELCQQFSELDLVESAYVKPAAELASKTTTAEILDVNTMTEEGDEGLPVTPNFVARQRYLDPAPEGIDANYAWTIPGGHGKGIRIIDCEWGWNFAHEDLLQNQMGVVVGTSTASLRANNHGTAVVGVIGGDRNTIGVTGICSSAVVGAASFVNMPSARVIRLAADRLRAGDILLLEIHRAGPRFNFQGRSDQRGYIAIEWWPDDFAAIRYAISRGIIVVEAAGNGAENFDDSIYNTRPAGFPASWRNPFNPANPSSQAVVVGAGAPPPGTHGRTHGPDRSRLGFSNFGRRVDCQGYGREVTSTGYGNLQGGPQNEWYTDTFSGTSSASPIVVGAIGCLQGILRHQGFPLLNAARAISLLRNTGSLQTDAPGRPRTQRIGNRPNLRQLISRAASGWSFSRRVRRVYALSSSRRVWVLLEGAPSWIRISDDAPNGVHNILTLLGEARGGSRLVDVYFWEGEVRRVVLR